MPQGAPSIHCSPVTTGVVQYTGNRHGYIPTLLHDMRKVDLILRHQNHLGSMLTTQMPRPHLKTID